MNSNSNDSEVTKRDSDASFQTIILLDEWAREFSSPPTLDEFYSAVSQVLKISRDTLWKILSRTIEKGLVQVTKLGVTENNQQVTYALTDLGQEAAHEARSLGIKRQNTWVKILALRFQRPPDQ